MPRLIHTLPMYRGHRGSNQADVTLNGRDYYLGPHGTKASRVEYDRLIGEWLAAGRQPLQSSGCDLTIAELCVRYWKFAIGYYQAHDAKNRSLRTHRELLLNWFRAKGTISAGVIEGFNNKAKLTMRKSYGFRQFENDRTGVVSPTWTTTSTRIHPRILLTRRKKRRPQASRVLASSSP